MNSFSLVFSSLAQEERKKRNFLLKLMLRCTTSKLTRSSHVTNSSFSFQLLPIKHRQSNHNIYYHQSVFNSQTRSESNPMSSSGSALDTIQDVLALIESFKVKSGNNQQSEQKYDSGSSSVFQASTNLPKFLIDTSIPFSHQNREISRFFYLDKSLIIN